MSRSYRKRRRSRTPSPSYSRSYSRTSEDSLDELANKDGDEEGQLDIRTGEYIKDRYKVLGLAGKGTFGTVLDVIDTKHDERLALKVVRSVKRYLEAAQVEMEILKKLKKADVRKNSLCVRLLSYFEVRHRGQRHSCLGFEKLGRSLYEFSKKNKHRGYTLSHVKCFAYQLIQSVGFCHSIKLVHTDLKPENILLCESDYRTTYREKNRGGTKDYRVPLNADIRLIDFGGATFEHDHHSRIVNTRQYRSPEVLLGIGWSYPSDMWSVGCILGELLTGDLLFGTHEDMEHLALMEKIVGKPLPPHMMDKAMAPYRERESRKRSAGSRSRSNSRERAREAEERERTKKRRRDRSSSRPEVELYIDKTTNLLKWPANASSSQSRRHVENTKNLSQHFEDRGFVDLLRGLLEFDPASRLTAPEALQHHFFDEQVRNMYPHISRPNASRNGSSSSSSNDSGYRRDARDIRRDEAGRPDSKRRAAH